LLIILTRISIRKTHTDLYPGRPNRSQIIPLNFQSLQEQLDFAWKIARRRWQATLAAPCLQQLSRQQSFMGNLTIFRPLGLIQSVPAMRSGGKGEKRKGARPIFFIFHRSALFALLFPYTRSAGCPVSQRRIHPFEGARSLHHKLHIYTSVFKMVTPTRRNSAKNIFTKTNRLRSSTHS